RRGGSRCLIYAHSDTKTNKLHILRIAEFSAQQRTIFAPSSRVIVRQACGVRLDGEDDGGADPVARGSVPGRTVTTGSEPCVQAPRDAGETGSFLISTPPTTGGENGDTRYRPGLSRAASGTVAV